MTIDPGIDWLIALGLTYLTLILMTALFIEFELRVLKIQKGTHDESDH